MDRKKQLSNVAFGGDWSEQIEVRERVQVALTVLQRAVDDSHDEDARRAEVILAATVLCDRIARGELMLRSWRAAAGIADQHQRRQALAAVLRNIQSGVGRAGHA